jgi:hypothetical protein
MIERLEQLTEDVAALHNRLIVLVGEPGAGKSLLLSDLGRRRDAPLLNVGSKLGARLGVLPVRQRALAVPALLRDLADEHTAKGILLLDNIEILFDRTLQLDPLDLLKQLSRSRRVVAVWPGLLRDGRLIYAELGHPEHQDYGLEGLVPFVIQ